MSRGIEWGDTSPTERQLVRAGILAGRWSALRNEEEAEQWRRQAQFEDGDPGPELDDCQTCHGSGIVNDAICTGADCVDGLDTGPERERERHEIEHRETRDLEREFIETQLDAMGARMMRPYEHWGEEERYYQWQEEGQFGHSSR